MSILNKICEAKREHVSLMKQKYPLNTLKEQIDTTRPSFIFEEALKTNKSEQHISIIAEIKKASPSKGVIRDHFNPKEIAKNYEQAGATCLSCLTDEPYFQGHDTYLTEVKETSTLPVLRKDFMIDLYQIYESRMLGADSILIIMAALDDGLAQDMYSLATELGMSALFEVHNRGELDRALSLNPRIIGVNNRNLKTLDVSLEVSHDLISFLPDSLIRISESGLSSPHDIKMLSEKGFDGFLIGESLMNAHDEKEALQRLTQ